MKRLLLLLLIVKPVVADFEKKSIHQEMRDCIDEQLSLLQTTISNDQILNALVLEKKLQMQGQLDSMRRNLTNKVKSEEFNEEFFALCFQKLKFQLCAYAELKAILIDPELLIKEFEAIISVLPKDELSIEKVKEFFELMQERRAKVILESIEKKSTIDDEVIKEQLKKELMVRINFFLQLKKAADDSITS